MCVCGSTPPMASTLVPDLYVHVSYKYTFSQDKIYILHSVSPTAPSPYLVSKCHLQDMVYMHVAVHMGVLYLAYTMYIMYMYCWAYGCDILTSCTLLSTCIATTIHVGGFTSSLPTMPNCIPLAALCTPHILISFCVYKNVDVG